MSTTATFAEHFSSFISLAAKITETEVAESSFERANFLRNMRDHDVGIWSADTRPLGRGGTFAVRRFVGDLETAGVDEHIALKTILTTYSHTDSAEVKARLVSAMLELRVLSHPRIRREENIVRLLSVAWQSDPVNFDRRWPVLLVEYADRGTLVDFFETENSVVTSLKWHLCLDVARGLQVLHRLKVFHGDIKLSNVLVYTYSGDANRPVIAKLADIGGALLDMEAECRSHSGTFPWTAPESGQLMSRSKLLQCDIYSFGLLVWRICVDGQNPFSDPSAGAYPAPLTKDQIIREKERPDIAKVARDSLLKTDVYGLSELFEYSLTSSGARDLEHLVSILEGEPILQGRQYSTIFDTCLTLDDRVLIVRRGICHCAEIFQRMYLPASLSVLTVVFI